MTDIADYGFSVERCESGLRVAQEYLQFGKVQSLITHWGEREMYWREQLEFARVREKV